MGEWVGDEHNSHPTAGGVVAFGHASQRHVVSRLHITHHLRHHRDLNDLLAVFADEDREEKTDVVQPTACVGKGARRLGSSAFSRAREGRKKPE